MAERYATRQLISQALAERRATRQLIGQALAERRATRQSIGQALAERCATQNSIGHLSFLRNLFFSLGIREANGDSEPKEPSDSALGG